MGVVYKLKPEIRDFILEKRKSEPNLGCRKISSLLFEKFQLKVSKSIINLLIKEAGLSMPVGRRLKKRRRRPEIMTKPQEEIKLLAPSVQTPVETPVQAPQAPLEMPAEIPCTGAILLRAADYLVGGSYYITEAIKNRLSLPESELFSKTEALLYSSLGLDVGLGPVDMSSYLNELQGVSALSRDISRVISNVFQEVRCVKVTLLDGASFYLDGQLHTVWSTPQIPYDFSTSIYNIKSYINKYFLDDKPFLLFMAPGYDTPTKEFFDFMAGLESSEKKIARLTLYGNKFEELETTRLEQDKRRIFIFGLWPWQFSGYRKVKTIGEFRPFYFEPLKEDFYLANIEIELSQPNAIKGVTLKGCALKRTLNEKIKLIILSNLPHQTTSEELANLYLDHWPNLDEAFQDFSRKIELFTYTAASQRFFSTENLFLEGNLAEDIKGLFENYLKALDLYVRWHLLPSNYEDEDFSTTNAQFYVLTGQLKPQKDHILFTFKPPQGYPFLKDLLYACRRINEREIIFPDGKRLWCNT